MTCVHAILPVGHGADETGQVSAIRLPENPNTAIMQTAQSGRGAVRLARLHGVQEVGGSNPLAPTAVSKPPLPERRFLFKCLNGGGKILLDTDITEHTDSRKKIKRIREYPSNPRNPCASILCSLANHPRFDYPCPREWLGPGGLPGLQHLWRVALRAAVGSTPIHSRLFFDHRRWTTDHRSSSAVYGQ